MKQFFKFTFASMLGFLFAGILLLFITIGIIASAVSMGKDEKTVVPDKTILFLTFDQPINERTSNNPFAHLNFNKPNASALGLNDIVSNIQNAANDPKVKGIYLELSGIEAGQATVEEIRHALIAFKVSLLYRTPKCLHKNHIT